MAAKRYRSQRLVPVRGRIKGHSRPTGAPSPYRNLANQWRIVQVIPSA